MKQREIWLVDLNPVRGSEQRGIRPVVVISGNAMNDHLGIAIVCPLTTRIKNYMGCLVLPMNKVNGLDADSEVITFQIRTVSGERFLTRLGEISEEELKLIRERLMEVLTY
jgi:mRNA interferase MazF